jgi:hypothetical protein
VGRVSESGFQIARGIRGRNSFNPVLFGHFFRSANGTRVKVILTLHPAVWVFMFFWTVSLGYFALGRGTIESGGVAFLLLSWVLAAVVFFYDAARSKDLLRKCLKLPDA